MHSTGNPLRGPLFLLFFTILYKVIFVHEKQNVAAPAILLIAKVIPVQTVQYRKFRNVTPEQLVHQVISKISPQFRM